MALLALGPQELQGDALALLQLLLDAGPVGDGPRRYQLARDPAEESRLQRRLVELGGIAPG